MHSIKQWLEQLGLPQYAEIFVGNDVDFETLHLLERFILAGADPDSCP